MATSYDLGPESLLGTSDGEDSQTLRDRLDLALRYIANWYRATKGSDSKEIWWARIDQVRAKVEAAFRAVDPADIFPRKSALAAYEEAALAFPQLYRDLYLSADTLPEPSLIDIAADIGDTILETPGYLVHKITNSIAKGVGGAAGSLLGNLWPYLALAGAAWALYTFREPLIRLAKKAAT